MWNNLKMLTTGIVEWTQLVFSFETPTLEHHCNCTYMHTRSVLLSSLLNWNVDSTVWQQSSDIAILWASHKWKVQCPLLPCSTFSIRMYIHVRHDLDGRSYTNYSDGNFYSKSVFLARGGNGVQAGCSPLPSSHPLSSVYTTYTPPTYDSTHTVVPSNIMTHTLSEVLFVEFNKEKKKVYWRLPNILNPISIWIKS